MDRIVISYCTAYQVLFTFGWLLWMIFWIHKTITGHKQHRKEMDAINEDFRQWNKKMQLEIEKHLKNNEHIHKPK